MATKNYYLPSTDAGKSQFQHNFGDKIVSYKAKYGISNAQETDIKDGDAYFKYWLDVLGEVEAFKLKVTGFKNELRDGVAAGAVASVAPVLQVLPLAPTAVVPGIFSRATSLAGSIKKHKDYVVSDGNDMGIEGSLQAPPDIINGQPKLKIVLVAGQPKVVWAKGGFDALFIEVDREGTGFKFLALDTEPDYLDTAALPANTALWKYRGTYILHDEKVGLRSDEVSMAVKA